MTKSQTNIRVAHSERVTVFTVFELALKAASPGRNPFVDGPSFAATFTGTTGAAKGKRLIMNGFWDGGNVWRIRFAPTFAGDWTYVTSSPDSGLDRTRGILTAVEPTSEELEATPLLHGFLEREGDAWKLSDGTPFLPVGDSQWSFSEEIFLDEWKQWIDVLQEHNFNTLLGCIWLNIYKRGGISPFPNVTEELDDFKQQRELIAVEEPDIYKRDRIPPLPSVTEERDGVKQQRERLVVEEPDTEMLKEHSANHDSWSAKPDTLNVVFFQILDEMVHYANNHGIMMGLTIGGFPNSGDWFDLFGTRERHDRWFRYCIARYAAYNVRWVLFGEVNEADPPWEGDWQDAVAYYARLVKEEDPYQHPVGSHHNIVDTSSADSPDIDYIEVQLTPRTETQYQSALHYRQYGKPVWFEEYWYETTIYERRFRDSMELGIRNTHRSFIAGMAFPTIGSLMRAHASFEDFPPEQANVQGKTLYRYLQESDPGIQRMSYFADFYKDLDLLHFSPAPHLVYRGQCGKFGDDYALFLEGGQSTVLDLRWEGGVFSVWALDINSGAVVSLGAIAGGEFHSIDPGTSCDTVVLVRKERKNNGPTGLSHVDGEKNDNCSPCGEGRT